MVSHYCTPLEITFGDVDSAGIVYYPRYGHYFHVAMERFFREALDFPYPRLLDQERIGLPTVRLETDYLKPLRYGDEATIEVSLESLGSSSVVWLFKILTQTHEAATTGRVVTVALDIDLFEKTEIPPWLRTQLEPHLIESQSPGGAGVG